MTRGGRSEAAVRHHASGPRSATGLARRRAVLPDGLARSRRPLDDRGSAAAEFAIVLPAIVLVIALGVGSLSAAARMVRLQDGAASAARLLGREESADAAAAALAGTAPGATMAIDRDGALVCVTALAASGMPGVGDLRARSCALGEGR